MTHRYVNKPPAAEKRECYGPCGKLLRPDFETQILLINDETGAVVNRGMVTVINGHHYAYEYTGKIRRYGVDGFFHSGRCAHSYALWVAKNKGIKLHPLK